jgi:hypothetical protein
VRRQSGTGGHTFGLSCWLSPVQYSCALPPQRRDDFAEQPSSSSGAADQGAPTAGDGGGGGSRAGVRRYSQMPGHGSGGGAPGGARDGQQGALNAGASEFMPRSPAHGQGRQQQQARGPGARAHAAEAAKTVYTNDLYSPQPSGGGTPNALVTQMQAMTDGSGAGKGPAHGQVPAVASMPLPPAHGIDPAQQAQAQAWMQEMLQKAVASGADPQATYASLQAAYGAAVQHQQAAMMQGQGQAGGA